MNQAVLSVFGNLNEIEVLFLTLCRREEKRLCGEEHEGTCMCVTLAVQTKCHGGGGGDLWLCLWRTTEPLELF